MKTKIWLAGMFLMAGYLNSQAQGLLGIFHQQADKKKLMAAQVAALLVYGRESAEGYAVNDSGLTAAHTRKGAELDAHSTYYASLSQVNQSVGATQKKKDILGMQSYIQTALSKEISWQQKHQGLRTNEMAQLQQLSKDMRDKTSADIAEMQEVITPGKLKLSDAERLDRLDRIAAAMYDKYAYTRSFVRQCRQLASERAAAAQDREQVRKLYGLK